MDIYNIVLKEYKQEDDNDQHKLIYSYFGLAVYFAQCLEETFSNMLILHRIKHKKIQTNQEVQAIINTIENSKKTMGSFIHEVNQAYDLTEELKVKLSQGLKTRNYIIHKYFKLHIEKFTSDIGKREMLKYFCDFISLVQQVDKDLEFYYYTYMNKVNITEDKLNKMIEKMKSDELKRDF